MITLGKDMGKCKESVRKWNAVFIIALMLSLPFYTASAAAASVQITKNQGQAGIPQFLDAAGDIWTVEATVEDAVAETIAPEKIRLVVGSNSAPFNSCSATAFGAVCSFVSPLTDGVQEGDYGFEVIYNFETEIGNPGQVSDGEVIRADGSAPRTEITHLVQNAAGEVEIDFTVTDRVRSGVPAAGLKKIEIVDADTGNVLQSISFEAPGMADYDYRDDGDFSGILQASLQGEGRSRLKVRAEDWLGHSAGSTPRTLDRDFVVPVISGEVSFPQLGEFLGAFVTHTDVAVEVQETNLFSVKGYPAGGNALSLSGQAADCEENAGEDTDVPGLWRCTWRDVEVIPGSDTLSLRVVAQDEKGNVAERTVSKTFTPDASAPQVEFFGTARTFESRSYVSSGQQELILVFREQGAGVRMENIRADLRALGRGSSEPPAECIEDVESGTGTIGSSATGGNNAGNAGTNIAGLATCFWRTNRLFESAGSLVVPLSRLRDNVGNEGVLPQVELVVDDTGPKVEELELFGVSEAGEKDYFQSNDRLKLRVKAVEGSGLVILLNLNGVVMDAENRFPETFLTSNFFPAHGWQIFTEDSCSRVEGGLWECAVETPEIRSGPSSAVPLHIKVQDTAGNDAQSWPSAAGNAELRSRRDGATLAFDLLGLSLEEQPDYWEVARAIPLGGASAFVDLDTTELGYTRMPLEVALRASGPNVQAVNVELLQCNPLNALAGQSAGASVGTVQGSGQIPVQSAGTASGSASPAATAGAAAPLTAPAISRALVYSGVSPEGSPLPRPKIILEFEPFNGRELFGIAPGQEDVFKKRDVPYECLLQIYSKVDRSAIRNAEMQRVQFTVPFGFTALGAQDENLEQRIKAEKDAVNSGLWGAIGFLSSWIRRIDYLVQVYTLIMGGISIYTSASAAFDGMDALPGGTFAKIAACVGVNTGVQAVDKTVTPIIDIPVQVLSCRPNPGGFGWYNIWVSSVLAIYNVELLESVGARQVVTKKAADGSEVRETERVVLSPARGLKDNLALSAAGLCVPGILENLDRYRQIKCRKIYCLENEVPANIATVESCSQLEKLLTCKYVFGELWYLIPFSQLYDAVIGALQRAWRDTIAFAHTLTIVGCGTWCLYSNSLHAACEGAYFIWDVVGYIENIAAFITTIAQDIRHGGLQYCDSVL